MKMKIEGARKAERIILYVNIFCSIMIVGVMYKVTYRSGGPHMTINELLTYWSFLAVIILAIAGWNIVRAQEEAERERIAKADAVILYRKIERASTACVGFLLKLTRSEKGNALKIFPGSVADDEGMRSLFLEWFDFQIIDLSNNLSDAGEFYDDLKPMYKFDTEFGDKFMDAIRAIVALNDTSLIFLENKSRETTEKFAKEKALQISNFLRLIRQVSNVALCLELCRKELGLDFDVGFQMSDIVSLSERFYDALEVDDPFSGETMTADEYVKLLETIEWIYGLEFSKIRPSIHAK